MLKKRLGINAIERDWYWEVNGSFIGNITGFFKIPSTLIIPESCRSIGVNAFWGYEKLGKVVISDGVKEIRDCAFAGCRKLRGEVVIPESVEKIGGSAFNVCGKATVILKKRKKDFKEIGRSAFHGCIDVKEEIRS